MKRNQSPNQTPTPMMQSPPRSGSEQSGSTTERLRHRPLHASRNPSHSSWGRRLPPLLASSLLLLGIGYALGSMSSISSSLSVSVAASLFRGLAMTGGRLAQRLEDWIHAFGVRLYALSTLAYLSVRWYCDRRGASSSSLTQQTTKQKPPNTNTKAKQTNQSRRWMLPSLRRVSTLTISEEDDDVDDDDGASLVSPSARTSPPAALQTSTNDDDPTEPKAPIDLLNGAFTVVANHNFDSFLHAQGVPWFLCKAASKARPTHTFVHKHKQHNLSSSLGSPTNDPNLTIKIRGIIDSETSYSIGGAPTETSIRKRVFRDTVRYLYDDDDDDNTTTTTTNNNTNDDDDNTNGDNTEQNTERGRHQKQNRCVVGLHTTKVAVGEGYHIGVERRIVPAGSVWVSPTPGHQSYDLHVPCDRHRLLMTNTIVYDNDNNNNDNNNNNDVSSQPAITASQLFHKDEDGV